jgi:hypothetical protein
MVRRGKGQKRFPGLHSARKNSEKQARVGGYHQQKSHCRDGKSGYKAELAPEPSKTNQNGPEHPEENQSRENQGRPRVEQSCGCRRGSRANYKIGKQRQEGHGRQYGQRGTQQEYSVAAFPIHDPQCTSGARGLEDSASKIPSNFSAHARSKGRTAGCGTTGKRYKPLRRQNWTAKLTDGSISRSLAPEDGRERPSSPGRSSII